MAYFPAIFLLTLLSAIMPVLCSATSNVPRDCHPLPKHFGFLPHPVRFEVLRKEKHDEKICFQGSIETRKSQSMEMNQPSRPQEPFSSTRAENDDTETGVTTSQGSNGKLAEGTELKFPTFAKKSLPATEHGLNDMSSPFPSKEDTSVPSVDSSLHSIIYSFAMIIVSEIGDKTFIIAALMAMRCSPLFVYSAALSALVAMTLLSALLGRSVPTLLPDTYTKMLAAVLFFAFGLKMLKEGYEMAPNEGLSSEISEVETELKEKDHERVRDGDQDTHGEIFDVEAGHDRQDCPADQSPASLGRNLSASHQFPGSVRCHWQSLMAGMSNLFSLFLSPLFVQIFAMTFFRGVG